MQLWILSVVIGALAGILTPTAWYFLELVTNATVKLQLHQHANFFSALLLPAAVAIALFALFAIFRAYRSADAFTYLISDIHFQEGRRKLRYSFANGIATVLLLAGGGVAGIEGFCFELLSALGGKLGSFIKLPPKQVRALASCGLSAGIAALLGQPMTAFLFAIELLYGWGGLSFTVGPFAISAFVAASLAQTLTSPAGIFRNLLGADGGLSQAIRGENLGLEPVTALISILTVSVCAAALAAFVIWLYRKTDKELHSLFATRRATDISPKAFAMRLVLWVVLTAAVSFYIPESLGSGISILHSSLSDGFMLKVTVLALLIRILMGTLAYTVFGTMGLVLPALVVGAMMGGSIAGFFAPFLSVNASTMALLSMGAFFSASFGTPVAATALVFGFAGGMASENSVFLFASLVTNFLAHYLCGFVQEDRMGSMGLYRHGIRFRSGMCFNTLSSIQVQDAMLSWVTPLQKNISIGEAYKTLMNSRFLKLPVVDAEGNYAGVLSLNDFYGLETWRKLGENSEVHNLLGITELIKQSAEKVRANMSLEDALKVMSDEDIAPVLEAEGNKFAGILLRSDLVNLYNKEVVKKAFRR